MKTMKAIITAILLLFALSSHAQTNGEKEALEWLRAHLQTVITHSDDSTLPFTKPRTYTFYDDAFVIKTTTDFN